MQIPVNSKLWEIEIWFKSLNDHSSDESTDLLKTINANQRKTILEIKKERSVKELGKNKLSSVDIYEGVLLKGYKTINDFQMS